MTEVQTGDVVRLTNFRHHNPLPKGDVGLLHVGFSAPKGEVFVMLFLGTESKDGSAPMDVVKRLKQLGWTPPEDLK